MEYDFFSFTAVRWWAIRKQWLWKDLYFNWSVSQLPALELQIFSIDTVSHQLLLTQFYILSSLGSNLKILLISERAVQNTVPKGGRTVPARPPWPWRYQHSGSENLYRNCCSHHDHCSADSAPWSSRPLANGDLAIDPKQIFSWCLAHLISLLKSTFAKMIPRYQ